MNAADGYFIATEADATPLQYLGRLISLREIFGVETRLEALIIENGRIRIATSQQFVKGRKPTSEEIRRMMQDFDFMKSPHGEAYYRRADNLSVWDAHTGNFLNSGGVIIPIDVICMPASPQMVKALGF